MSPMPLTQAGQDSGRLLQVQGWSTKTVRADIAKGFHLFSETFEELW
jgi:hypothetical protein